MGELHTASDSGVPEVGERGPDQPPPGERHIGGAPVRWRDGFLAHSWIIVHELRKYLDRIAFDVDGIHAGGEDRRAISPNCRRCRAGRHSKNRVSEEMPSMNRKIQMNRAKLGVLRRRRTTVMLVAIATLMAARSARAQWHQWGGPSRDFSVKSGKLADKWPDNGPRRIWERPLGEGYSTIVADGGMLYTMYRVEGDEFTVALDAKTGETVWEHKNAAPIDAERSTYGPGPYATPLIVGDRLYSVGTNSVVHCFEKKSGEVSWKRDLIADFGSQIQGFGYSTSPIAYRNTIIVPVGRRIADDAEATGGKAPTPQADSEAPEEQSLIAFDQRDGSVVWERSGYGRTKFNSTYSSGIMINFAGRDQFVLFMATELAGLDPTTGERLWGVEHKTSYDENVSTPIWDGVDTLFCSSGYGTGSRAIKLVSQGGTIAAKEQWYSKKMRVLHGNVVRVGDYVYGSSGDFGPVFFAGMDIRTGKLAWRERGFKKATVLESNGRIIILDEEGKLALATATPDALTIHSDCKLDLHGAWATPTLIDETMYVRDRKKIVALDLGKAKRTNAEG